MGNNTGVGIQWPFFRFEITPAGMGFFPITNSLLFVQPGISAISQFFLFFGVVSLVISYVMLYYRATKTAREAGLLTLLGAILILCSSITEHGVFFSGPAGISVPVGVPLILVLGIMMYRYSPQDPEIPTLKKRKFRPGISGTTGRKTEENTVTRADPADNPAVTPDYYVSLVVLNFVANYIFLSYYGFVGDDWSTMSPVNAYSGISFIQLFFEPQRPFTYIFIKMLPLLLGYNQVLFFVVSFILTSILLIVVFIVTHSLLNQIKKCPPSYAFLISVLYCILYNKGELYAFGGTMPNTVASILFFVSFYYFMHSENKPYYIYISLICFTFALFTYELGIFFPILYLIFALAFKKPVKNVLMFAVPVGFFGIVRLTNWFGYGYILSKASVISLSNLLSPKSIADISMFFSENVFVQKEFIIKSIYFGTIGLKSLPFSTIILLFLLNWCVAVVIVWILLRNLPPEGSDLPKKGLTSLIMMGLAGIVFPFILISLHGLMATRYMGFIDFFASLVVILVVMKYIKNTSIVTISLFLTIVFCITINQGLCFNYVVSHNIQHNLDEAIMENAEDIRQYKTIYINVENLRHVQGNYWNAIGIQSWSIRSMMMNAGLNTSEIKLVYNVNGEEPGDIQTLGDEPFFEFNRTNVNMENIHDV